MASDPIWDALQHLSGVSVLKTVSNPLEGKPALAWYDEDIKVAYQAIVREFAINNAIQARPRPEGVEDLGGTRLFPN